MPRWINLALLFPLASPVLAVEEEALEIEVDLSIPNVAEERPGRPDFRLQYVLGGNLQRPSEVVANRLEGGIKWQKKLDTFFVNLDGKIIVYTWDDDELDDGERIGFRAKTTSAYGQWSGKILSFSFGYQHLIWGELDTASVTDVLSPWDLTEFAFANPQEARFGQAMMQVNAYWPLLKMDLVVIPLVETSRSPQGLAANLQTRFPMGVVLQEDKPKDFSDVEWAMRWKSSRDSGDYAVMAASVLDNDPNIQILGIGPSGAIIQANYPRFEVLGLNANYARGKTLYQLEIANYWGREIGAASTDQFALGLGLEYTNLQQHRIVLESRFLHNQRAIPLIKRDDVQLVFRWSKNYLNETLSMGYYFNYGVSYDDQIHNFNLQYRISDNWSGVLNVSLYEPKADSPLSLSDDWDQLSIGLTVNL